MKRRDLLLSAALCNLGCANAIQSPDGFSLNDRARRKGFFFGAAVNVDGFYHDENYRAALIADCGAIIPESSFGWNWTQGGQREAPPAYKISEDIFSFAQSNKMQFRGHPLIYHIGVPPWVSASMSSRLGSAAIVEQLISQRVSTTMAAWKGRVSCWTVVNEPLASREHNIWKQRLGEQYIDLAFNTAAATDPTATLLLNQDLVEMDEPFQRRQRADFLLLLERLISRGVRVDAVGIEGHLWGHLKFNPKGYRDFLEKIGEMGVDIYVTELDVWDGKISGSVDSVDRTSAALVKDFLDTTFDAPKFKGLLTWTLTDRFAWYKSAENKHRLDGRENRAGPLDNYYKKKPMWYAIANAIDHAPIR